MFGRCSCALAAPAPAGPRNAASSQPPGRTMRHQSHVSFTSHPRVMFCCTAAACVRSGRSRPGSGPRTRGKTGQSRYPTRLEIAIAALKRPVFVQAISDGCQGLPGAAVAGSAGIEHQRAEPVFAEGHPDTGSNDRVDPVLGLAEGFVGRTCARPRSVSRSVQKPRKPTPRSTANVGSSCTR